MPIAISDEMGFEKQKEIVLELITRHQERINPRRPLEETEFIYCLVGNVVPCHFHGEEKKIVRGINDFAANAKLYVFPFMSGGRIRVVGMSIKTKKYKFTRIPVTLITNWRLQKVFKKKVIELMYQNDGWRDTEVDRQAILNVIPLFEEETAKNLPFQNE